MSEQSPEVEPSVDYSRPRLGQYGLSAIQLGALTVHGPMLWLAENLDNQPSLTSAGLIGVSVFAVACFLVGALVLIGIDLPRATALVSAALVVFWNWPSMLRPIGSVPPQLSATILSGVLLVVAYVSSARRAFRIMLFVGALTVALTPLALIVSQALPAAQLNVINPNRVLGAVAEDRRPDIYVVVFDGYARGDVLRGVYGHDNTPFIDSLRSQGFSVAEAAHSNYSITHFSLASLLEMDYLAPPGTEVTTADLSRLRMVLSGDNAFVRELKHLGYTYLQGPHGWWGTQCTAFVDVCLPTVGVDQTAFELLRATPLRHFIYGENGDPGTAVARQRLEQFETWNGLQQEQPTLALIHMSIPHPPLFLDETCSPIIAPERFGRVMNIVPSLPAHVISERRFAYVQQIECSNLMAQTIVESAPDDAIILFLSDHGPDSFGQLATAPEELTSGAIAERMGILAAARLPEDCEDLENDISLVNLLATVSNCVFGSNRELRRSRFFIAPATGSPHTITEIDSVDGYSPS